MKPRAMLPNLLTLANAACGLLAVSKGIDALAWHDADPAIFYAKMEAACFLIFLGMLFDALDGWVARLTSSFSPFGAQLDSLADCLTFGVAPALLAKVLIEHEGTSVGALASPRLHFAAAAFFSLMAILRLARFNLEGERDPAREPGGPDPRDGHSDFRGLPSPAAAGAVASWLWFYLVLSRPELEVVEGTPTPLGHVMGWARGVDWGPLLSWVPATLTVALPLLGLLMVSRVRYVHLASWLQDDRSPLFTLVTFVFAALALYLAPVPFLFLGFNTYVLYGLVQWLIAAVRARRSDPARESARP